MNVETFHNGRVILHGGDCLKVLAEMPENSVDAVVTDPPYHFNSIVKRFGKPGSAPPKSNGNTRVYHRTARGFMGKDWDGGQIAHEPETWAAVARVLKPGGHLVAFHAPKNWHRQACAIEDAGFEIRDTVLDLSSPGELSARFLASLSPDQSQALIRIIEANDPLGDLFWLFGSGFPKSHNLKGRHESWGTALKPAYEPIVLARKPFRGSVAECAQDYGTGAINIDGCRIACEGGSPSVARRQGKASHLRGETDAEANAEGRMGNRTSPERYRQQLSGEQLGRWPANVTHDGSAGVTAAFPDAPGQHRALNGGEPRPESPAVYGRMAGCLPHTPRGDSGSAARFFYSAKADGDDRLGSKHPTVKPIDLMRWLVRMVTPPGGTVLDPFAGTGTTAQAAFAEGFSAILIEREEEYRADIRRRMDLLLAGPVAKAAALNNDAPDYGPLFGGTGEAWGGAEGLRQVRKRPGRRIGPIGLKV